jgi:PKHD-type hydroxylase
MVTHNAYWWFESIITPEVCQKIISLGESKLKEAKSQGISTLGVTGDNKEKQSVLNGEPMQDKTYEELHNKNVYVRDSEVAWLNEKWLYDLLLPQINIANKLAGWGYDIDSFENFQFTKYHPGGFYGWHADGTSDRFSIYKRYIPGISPTNDKGKMLKYYTRDTDLVGKVRKISMTLNLNVPGEYEGGNLKFDFGPHSVEKRYHECVEIRPQGSMIVFPSFVYHQVTPVTRGTRYSLVLWTLGKPFK